MKPVKTIFKPFLLLASVLVVYFISIASFSCAQSKEEKQVKVKIVKTVDGKTVTVEKTMGESRVKEFTKQFENIEGDDVQVMITLEAPEDKRMQASFDSSAKDKSASSMHFNFDFPDGKDMTGIDSVLTNFFSKKFMFHDSLGKFFNWNDSLFKNLPDLPKDFDFNFDFDKEGVMNNFGFDIKLDNKDETTGNGNEERDEEDAEEESGSTSDQSIHKNFSGEHERKKTTTKTKTLILKGDKNTPQKKVVVSTSVIVTDMEEKDGGLDKSKSGKKEESTFEFYPNPSDGNFLLDLDSNEKEEVLLRITDVNGKEVYKGKFSGNGKTSNPINLGSHKNGTFIVTIKQGKKTSSKKIIIE
jgi:Secretion system C-terminal sorting domain